MSTNHAADPKAPPVILRALLLGLSPLLGIVHV
jgi:hypothetical protein